MIRLGDGLFVRPLKYAVIIATVLIALFIYVISSRRATPSSSRAEFVNHEEPVAQYTAMPASSLSSDDLAAAVDARTTRGAYVFVPHSAAGDSAMMAVVTCRIPGTDASDAIANATPQGGLFRVAAGVHVRALDPLDRGLHSVRIVTDDGYVGSVCADAIAPL